jgi:hypothetical protein
MKFETKKLVIMAAIILALTFAFYFVSCRFLDCSLLYYLIFAVSFVIVSFVFMLFFKSINGFIDSVLRK